jgi:hypothetical protein
MMHMHLATAAALEMEVAAGPEQLAFCVLYWTSSQLRCLWEDLGFL